jgi:hypothetical protein
MIVARVLCLILLLIRLVQSNCAESVHGGNIGGVAIDGKHAARIQVRYARRCVLMYMPDHCNRLIACVLCCHSSAGKSMNAATETQAGTACLTEPWVDFARADASRLVPVGADESNTLHKACPKTTCRIKRSFRRRTRFPEVG